MKAIRSSAVAAALVLMLAACGDDDKPTTKATSTPTASGTSLAILTPVSGSTVKGNVVSLDLGRQLPGHPLGSADGDHRAFAAVPADDAFRLRLQPLRHGHDRLTTGDPHGRGRQQNPQRQGDV